jgi:hypothetical protein
VERGGSAAIGDGIKDVKSRSYAKAQRRAEMKKARTHFFSASLRLCVSLFFLLIFWFGNGVRAQSLSYPLQGYYHPGRAMPVRWDSPSAGGSIELSAVGAITTRVNSTSQARGIIPFIVVDPNPRQVSDRSLAPLRALESTDVLLASTLDNDSAPASFFPNKHLVIVRINLDDLAGSATSWETLDGLLLTGEDLQKLAAQSRANLIMRGITLAVRTDYLPGYHAVRSRDHFWWKLPVGIEPPPMISADAYGPVEGWTPGRPPPFRREIVLFAAIYCLIVCGIALWRSRWSPAVIVAASILASIFFAVRYVRQPSISHQSGGVYVPGYPPLNDWWDYQISPRATDFAEPLYPDDCFHPILADLSQLTDLNLTIHCDGSGNPVALSGELRSNVPFATLHRTNITSADPTSPELPVTTPLRLLANTSFYPDTTIAGERANRAVPGIWPTLILSRNPSP